MTHAVAHRPSIRVEMSGGQVIPSKATGHRALSPAAVPRLRTTVQIAEIPSGSSIETTSLTDSMLEDDRFRIRHRNGFVVGPLMVAEKPAGCRSARGVSSRRETDWDPCLVPAYSGLVHGS